MKTVEIKGVWLLKDTGHNGNAIRVVVETADGVKHVAIELRDDPDLRRHVGGGS